MNLYILTKESCPNCDALKMFLAAFAKNKYDKHITWVQKEKDLEGYNQLIKDTGTQSVPTLVLKDGDSIKDTVMGFNPGQVKALLERHFNEPE